MSDAGTPRRRRRLPAWRPAHGWTDFATELAIVVLGVLIALGAQQAIDYWHTQSDVADFRAALNAELASDLGAYRGRMLQSRCLAARLDELDRWQAGWNEGAGAPLGGSIGRPLAYTLNTSVWRTGAMSVAMRMPLKERLVYAGMYDDFEAYDGLRFREVAVWQALFAYDGARRLSPPEVNALRGLILSARSTDRSMRLNWPDMVRRGASLGVHPHPLAGQDGTGNGLCAPLRVAG